MDCTKCYQTKYNFSNFLDLSLSPVDVNIQRINFLEMVETFKQVKIEKDVCPVCKAEKKFKTTQSVCKLPEILVISFKRFKEVEILGNLKWIKANYKVTVPFIIDGSILFENLGNITFSIIKFFSKGYKQQKEQDKYIYKLSGIADHFGSIDRGHYTA